MKILILLLLFIYFGTGIFGNDSILSKFHQNTFKLRDVRIQVNSYNDDYFNIMTVKAFKYNRTTTAHNITANLKVDVEDKLEALVQAYKFMSNEYRHFPLRFQVNAKKSFDANVIGLGSFKNCGNLTTFYFYKDTTYHACNFVIDETRFPPLIPNGKYKMDVKGLYFNEEVSWLSMFLEIYTPIEYPKK